MGTLYYLNILTLFQFEPNFGDIKKETAKQLDILKNLGQDRSIIDKTKAANLQLAQEDSDRYIFINQDQQKFSAQNCEYFLTHQILHLFWVLNRTVSLSWLF